MKFSILKNEATESYIGASEPKPMTRMPTSKWINGQLHGTFLKLTGEDARAYEEYQSMLRQL